MSDIQGGSHNLDNNIQRILLQNPYSKGWNYKLQITCPQALHNQKSCCHAFLVFFQFNSIKLEGKKNNPH